MANEKDGKDFLTLGPELSNGLRPFVRHTADHEMMVGVSRIVEDGKPIPEGGTLLNLTALDDQGTYSVETMYESKGPAKVNSPRYKQGWDAIFGKTTVGSA
jgi:hypothetical protein